MTSVWHRIVHGSGYKHQIHHKIENKTSRTAPLHVTLQGQIRNNIQARIIYQYSYALAYHVIIQGYGLVLSSVRLQEVLKQVNSFLCYIAILEKQSRICIHQSIIEFSEERTNLLPLCVMTAGIFNIPRRLYRALNND